MTKSFKRFKRRTPKKAADTSPSPIIARTGLATTREACNFLRLSPRTIARMIKAGKLAVVRINGRTVRIQCESLWQIATYGC